MEHHDRQRRPTWHLEEEDIPDVIILSNIDMVLSVSLSLFLLREPFVTSALQCVFLSITFHFSLLKVPFFLLPLEDALFVSVILKRTKT